MSEESWRTYSSTLTRLLRRPTLLSRFQEDMDGTATAELNISEEMRTDLKNLLLTLSTASESEPPEPGPSTEDDKVVESVLSAERFFESTYKQIRRGALTTTLMSVTIFVMGVVLLGLAASESITQDDPGTAIVVAASGLGAIAAAFYRSPVTQIRESAAETQQATMILLSYMLGLSLLSKSLRGKRTSEEAEMLSSLTQNLVTLLRSGQPGLKATAQKPAPGEQ